MAVAALGTALVLPALQRLGGRQEERELARRMQALADWTRGRALVTGREMRLLLDGRRRLVLAGPRRLRVPEEVEVRQRGLREDAEGRPFVAFFPDGSCSGGEILLYRGRSVAVLRFHRLLGGTRLEQGVHAP